METLLIGIICLLFILSAFLFWKNGRAVSKEQYEQAVQSLQQVQVELGRFQERDSLLLADRDRLQRELSAEMDARAAAERNLEGTTSYLQAQQEKFAQQKIEIDNIRKEFSNEFQVLANRILEEKTLKFTEQNKLNIDQILTPLSEKIKSFEDKVEKTYRQESSERNVLKGVVEQLMQQSVQIRDEANNLAKALKGDNKRQGNWGEVILERVLERSGLVKDREFKLQATIIDDSGKRLQPDALIYLPEDKHIVVDSKLSLVAYERAVNEQDEQQREIFIKQHIQSIENHVKELSAKDYQSLYEISSPDFVLMFMPIESSLSLAVIHKPELFSEAWDRRVVIVSPSTLLATLRTISSIWKQERQNRNVIEIAKEAGLLYDKFVGFIEDMEQIHAYLFRATSRQEEAMRKLSTGPGNMVKKIESLRNLGAKASKRISQRYLEE